MKGNLLEYQGSTNDERVKNQLIEAKELGFNIIPCIEQNTGRKGYSIWRNVNGVEEGYNPYIDEWIEGFPKIGQKTAAAGK